MKQADSKGRQRLQFYALIWGAWTLISVVFISQSFVFDFGGPPEFTMKDRVFMHLSYCYLWACCTPLVLRLSRWLQIRRGVFLRNLLLQLLLGAGFATLFGLVFHTLGYAYMLMPRGKSYRIESALLTVGMNITQDIVVYALLLLLEHAHSYYRRFQQGELRAAQLKTQLTQARLETLRMQLHPHFLFNTLNSVVGLIRNHENKAAVAMTTELSELLRHVLIHSEEQEVPLWEELNFLERYLNIQQARFADYLSVRLEIEPEVQTALVPNLILQPLVENAIRHGIALHDAPGTLRVSARRQGERLWLEIQNDGPTLPPNWRMEECQGVGLANTSARLQQLYGAEQQFELHNCDDNGVRAALVIPFVRDRKPRHYATTADAEDEELSAL
jgi:two-component system, LytTR family, sensor kinase